MKNTLFSLLLCGMSMSVWANQPPISLQKEMPYFKARDTLIQQGWVAFPVHTELDDTAHCYDDRKYCKDMYEIVDCSGSGEGLCKMFFMDKKTYRHFLSVFTRGGDPSAEGVEPNQVVVTDWQIEKEIPRNKFQDIEQNLEQDVPMQEEYAPRKLSHEEKCLIERKLDLFVLEELATKPYQKLVNEWRNDYFQNQITFNVYQIFLKRANAFLKLPKTEYNTKQAREKTANIMFDLCVEFPIE